VARTHTLILVGLGADAPAGDTDLLVLAGQVDARIAYLQLGSPALVEVLDGIARDAPRSEVRLVAVPSMGGPAPARSWLRRVAGHWMRENPGALAVRVPGGAVTGTEAKLSSQAWEQIPRHGRHVLVCRGPRCTAKGSAATADAINDQIRARRLGDDDVLVTQTGCLFPCNHAPVVVLQPDDRWWGPVYAEGARELVDSWAVAPRAPIDRTIRRVH
jgi:(2Fe-2S) ferredoxin